MTVLTIIGIAACTLLLTILVPWVVFLGCVIWAIFTETHEMYKGD